MAVLGLTVDPSLRILLSHVYPYPERTGRRADRPAAGHARSPHPARPGLRPPARPGHRARHRAAGRERAAHRSRVALPCAAADRGARLDCSRVGRVRQQPPGPLLRADQAGTQAARGADDPVAAAGRGHRAHSRPGGGVMWTFRRRREDDFAREIETHLAIETDRLVADGMSPDAARRAAQRRFGNATHARERFYESRRLLWVDDLFTDARHAWHALRRSPGFA